ncbi:unnamed protein product [Cylindrotheca closterium]|uniref:Bestrophin homolog n=1 Tax=Cylindrotheca closterium TaxID=2856 RepID=A0AAD2PVY5_9STRA|nr:unnamed protein product [Cylindrotheca closterium]
MTTTISKDGPEANAPSSLSTSNGEASKEDAKLSKTIKAILDPDRIEALLAFDATLVRYEPFSFLVIFRFQGRNWSMMILPLLILGMLDLAWWFILHQVLLPSNAIRGIENGEMTEDLTARVERLDELVSPILVPVSFLLVFRLGRAAVRFWDARSAMGKLIEVCRTFISTAVVGCQACKALDPPALSAMNIVELVHAKKQDDVRLKLVRQFARWTCVFPIAVRNFLRPESRAEFEACCNLVCNSKRTKGNDEKHEMGISPDLLDLVSFQEATELQHSAFPTIFVLNKMRLLAWDASESAGASPSKQALLYRQLNEQIDILTGAWGAMERINLTPLPFVYVAHLRTFLMLYLCFWHISSIALNGWVCIPPLMIASWGLLGIEAAAVECERPFHWNRNHLALGKMGVVVAKNVHQTLLNCGYS